MSCNCGCDESCGKIPEQVKVSEAPKFSAPAKIINGVFAGFIGVLGVFPLDLVKTRMQTQLVTQGKPQYSSIANCFSKIYAQDGIKGFYKGVHVAAFMAGPEKGLKLIANDFYRSIFSGGKKITLPREVFCGGLAGLTQAAVASPAELMKIQFQDSGRGLGSKETSSKITLSMLFKKFSEKGLLSLYRGGGATIARDVLFSAIYFPLFFKLNGIGPKRKNHPDETVAWWTLLCGLFSGGVSALLVTPVDVVKTRTQLMKTVEEGGRLYNGYLDCVRTIFREESWRAFFKGGACRLMTIAPLFAITQAVYYLGVGEFVTGQRKKEKT